MARVQLPNSRLKRRKRIRRTRLAIVLGVAALLLIGIIVGLSWIPYIRIQAVEVAGAQTLASSTVEQFVSEKIEGRTLLVLPKNNILLYPKGNITSRLLSEYPVLKKIEVRPKSFSAIRVALTERTPKALWCGLYRDETGGCRLMDETGFVYTGDLGLELPSYIRYTGTASTTLGYTGAVEPQQYLHAETFAALTALVDALANNQKQTSVVGVHVDEHNDVRVTFANSFVLMFALQDINRDVYERFVLALASEPFLNKTTADFEYLDLRFGDKLYYKER